LADKDFRGAVSVQRPPDKDRMTHSQDQGQAIDREGVAAYVAAAPDLIGLPIPAEYREGVIANLHLILIQSAQLLALELDPAQEAAPVFRP
jgi:hypothetical protein